MVGYGLAFYLMAQVLRTLPLGLTYAVWSGVGTALTAAVSGCISATPSIRRRWAASP